MFVSFILRGMWCAVDWLANEVCTWRLGVLLKFTVQAIYTTGVFAPWCLTTSYPRDDGTFLIKFAVITTVIFTTI